MPGFFEAFKNFKPPKNKVHTVKIQGQNIVVTLEKKLEVMRHGEHAYIWKNPTEFVLKPKPKVKKSYHMLKKMQKGYKFYNGDPFYPTEIVDGGFAWYQE